jgi:hypothetical protein
MTTHAATVAFAQAYRRRLADYISHGEEEALREAYELGRQAIAAGLSLLQLCSVHHEALSLELASSRPLSEVARRSGDFLMESLSSFEMVHRGFREAVERSAEEHRHAAVIRGLSDLLSDGTLVRDTGSTDEMLRLVVEQARELAGARWCSITAVVNGSPVVATDALETSPFPLATASGAHAERRSIPLIALDGRRMGTLDAEPEVGGFADYEVAVLELLAQMTSAALERQSFHSRGR